MGGTIVCGVSETGERGPADLAAALSSRLGMRLVLVHVLDGIPGGATDSLTSRQLAAGAERALELLARDIGEAETRLVVGERAEGLAQVAAEEGADLVVIGARPVGSRGRKLRCDLARGLEAATPVPVAIAPPATRKRAERRLAAPIGVA